MRNILQRLGSLGRRGAIKRDVDEELRFHLEQRTAENIAAGMSADDAAREARKKFGNLQNVREECRDARGASFGETVWQDVRFGARMLLKDRSFTFIAVLTLALGIGANTSMFSLLNLLHFRPGPYPHPERLVRIFRTSPQSQAWPHSAGDLLDYGEQNTSFDQISFYAWSGFNLAEPGEPAEQLMGIRANADIFPALGIRPALGRVFDATEDQPGNRVVVLGFRCWQSRFAGDTNIIGRTVRLDGQNCEVIGVMPADFDYPLLWGTVDLCRPIGLGPEQRQDRGSHFLHAFGRLKAGVSISVAEAELKSICARLPNTGHDSLRFVPLVRSGYSETGQRMLYFTFGVAGFVLLIACANLANLQLARATGRWREFAIRTALGASRVRLMRQMLTESLLVSLVGGGLGLALAYVGKGFVCQHIPYMGQGLDVPLDPRVLGFALVCALLTGIVFGTAPAWFASRSDVNDALKEQRRGATGSRWQNLLRQGLVVGELAVALALLAGAGLFIRKLEQLTSINPGWRVDGLITGQIALNSAKYNGASAREAGEVLLQRLEQGVAALPGIESVSFSGSLPVWGFNSSGNFTVAGQPTPKFGEAPLAYKEAVSPAYFRTFGIPLKEGRVFTADDAMGRPGAAVINESMARRFWPGESAIGKRISCEGDLEIVGVVNDVRFPGALGASETSFQIYRPLSQSPQQYLRVALRTRGDARSVGAGLRRAVATLDPDLAVQDIQATDEAVGKALANVSLTGKLLAAFAVLGLALAALGIYGVISYSITQRTGEFGIRMALGAPQQQVLWLVLRQGLVLSILGVMAGLGGAMMTARLLSALLPELSGRDPFTFGFVSALLFVVALLACYVPARRVTQIDPMQALRYE